MVRMCNDVTLAWHLSIINKSILNYNFEYIFKTPTKNTDISVGVLWFATLPKISVCI